MKKIWVTNGSTTIPPIVNPLNAACHADFVPTEIYLLTNPGISDVTDPATSLMKTIVTAYGGTEPSITAETIEE